MSDPKPASKRQTRVERLKDLLHCQTKSVVSRMLVKNGGGKLKRPPIRKESGGGQARPPVPALFTSH